VPTMLDALWVHDMLIVWTKCTVNSADLTVKDVHYSVATGMLS
jgi:hypothetical protein